MFAHYPTGKTETRYSGVIRIYRMKLWFCASIQPLWSSFLFVYGAEYPHKVFMDVTKVAYIIPACHILFAKPVSNLHVYVVLCGYCLVEFTFCHQVSVFNGAQWQLETLFHGLALDRAMSSEQLIDDERVPVLMSFWGKNSTYHNIDVV